MGKFSSIVLALVLTAAVGASAVSGTMASLHDIEISDENYMCAGTVNLEMAGESFSLENLIPCKWYSKEKLLINAGTLDAVASVHIKNLVCVEDAPGAGVATTEPELVAEEGGKIGQQWVGGLGVDIHNIADYIDVKLWYDSDDDGVFELIAEGKLSDIACNIFILGTIPGNPKTNIKGGGWASYFEYFIGDPMIEIPLMMGQNTQVGTVSVWTDILGNRLIVKYDTSSSGWEMAETAVYVSAEPPDKLAPGTFPYKHDPVTPPLTTDLYEIPLEWSGQVYIAAHAAGTDNETAWAKGVRRRFKMEVHFPDIAEGELGFDYFDENDPNQAKWDHWPTNAYQGDSAIFDTEFFMNGLSWSNSSNKKEK